MQRRITLTAAVLITAMLCTRVLAQQTSPSDKQFLKCAAIGNMCEIKQSEAAVQQSQNAEVKKLAQQLINDHKKALEEVRTLAAKKNVDIPADLPKEAQEQVTFLTSLSGKDFDEEYICAMKAGHAMAISVVEDKSQLAKDQDIKQWATKTLPTLREHKQQVLALAQSQLGITSEDARTAGAKIGGTDTSGGTTGDTSGGTTEDIPSGTPKNP